MTKKEFLELCEGESCWTAVDLLGNKWGITFCDPCMNHEDTVREAKTTRVSGPDGLEENMCADCAEFFDEDKL